MDDDVPLFPVAQLDIFGVPSEGLIIMRPHFLSHALQKISEADPGRNYALTLKQAADLRDALDKAIHQLQNAGTQPPQGPKH
ncbi:MAG: hypothetical protein WB444_03630 [Gallionella sp.]